MAVISMDESFEREILSVVVGHEPVTVPEIASHLDAHPVRVQRHCTVLQDAGHLRQVTGGLYVPGNRGGDEHVAAD